MRRRRDFAGTVITSAGTDGLSVEGGVAGEIGTAAKSEAPVVKPYNKLKSEGPNDAHHIYQNKAVENIPGYKKGQAPSVKVEGPNTKGTPHYNATQVQRLSTGGGTLGAERNIAYKALRAAGFSQADAKAVVRAADKYFENLGATLKTPTNIPTNRMRP